MSPIRLSIALFFFSFFAGFAFIFSSQDAHFRALKTHLARDPATIRPPFDFSGLQGQKVLDAAKKRLVTSTRIVNRLDRVGIEIGHFVIRGLSGQKIFACEGYQNIQLTFEGDGSIIDGRRPTMELNAPCRISSTDINRMETIWLQSAAILSQPAGIQKLDLDEQGTASLQFRDVVDEWPRIWVLTSVYLLGESGKIEVTSEDFSALASEVPSFELK